MIDSQIKNAAKKVKAGGVIVYPTESVFGLGCDPLNQSAVEKLLKIKNRDIGKGLILIASHVEQVLPYISPHSPNDLSNALKTWSGHHSWVFPKSKKTPSWVSGNHESVAVRVSQHKTVVELCNELGYCLTSTSANISNHKVMTSIAAIKKCFGDKIDAYVDAPLGESTNPSQIKNAQTLEVYR